MGWQDRGYNQINYGGTPFQNPLLNLLFGSVPLGHWFGIRVRVHASLLWLIGIRLLMAGRLGWVDSLAFSLLIFAIVLLHEFGHCIAARLVGGRADDILLWPLGGLAFTDTERTPWARFVTVAGGPLVNVLLMIPLGLTFYFAMGAVPPLNPLFPWVGEELLKYARSNPQVFEAFFHPTLKWVWWAWQINFSILIFNLLPMYPMDGGKLLQVALWKPVGYYKSMYISCVVGMVGAVLLAFVGLFLNGGLFLVFLAVFGFMDCFQQLRILKFTRTEAESDPYDLSAAWENPDRPTPVKKRRKKHWFGKARKMASQEQAEQARIDAILAKVKEKGLHSLTWWEKRTLRKATERQRQQDLAERL